MFALSIFPALFHNTVFFQFIMKQTSSSMMFLRTLEISFRNERGSELALDSIVQDTMPSGSPIGTVVGLHGAPGTHNDFKYVMPHLTDMGIRFVGINYPGLGVTPNNDTLCYTNTERNNFVLATLDALQLNENVVFLGHSRGAQNGFQLGIHEEQRCRGIILANPTGLRPHKSYPPHFLLRGFRRLYKRFTFMRVFWHMFMNFVYNNILGLRVPSGEAACAAYRCLEHIEFAGAAQDWIDKWNQSVDSGKRLVIAYGARDNLIEESISEEFAQSFENAVHLTVPGRDEAHEGDAVAWMKEQIRDSQRNLVVCFKQDDHFLQKHKARFLAEAANSILKASNNN